MLTAGFLYVYFSTTSPIVDTLGSEVDKLRANSELRELVESLHQGRISLSQYAIEYTKKPHPNLRTKYDFGLTKFEIDFNRALNLATDKQAIENIGEVHDRIKVIELGVMSSSVDDMQLNLEVLVGDEYGVLSENLSFFVNQYFSRGCPR